MKCVSIQRDKFNYAITINRWSWKKFWFVQETYTGKDDLYSFFRYPDGKLADIDMQMWFDDLIKKYRYKHGDRL